jgi:heptosyltransferase III
MKTLVYHAGALGDFITILPSLVAYRKLHSEHNLMFLGRKAHGDLGIAAGYFSEAFDIDSARFVSLFSNQASPATKDFFSSFREAIVFAANDSPIIHNLSSAGISAIHLQPPFPSDRIHVIDYHLSLFPKVFLTDGEKQPSININLWSTIKKKNMVVIHPGSGSKKKNWPLEQFIELANRLKKVHCDIVWILGPAESTINLSSTDSVIREPSLIDLCQILQSAWLFIGNDSGVAHLAAACGCASAVLFGPSDPAVWAPRGKSITIVKAKKSEDILPDNVMKAINSIDSGNYGYEQKFPSRE